MLDAVIASDWHVGWPTYQRAYLIQFIKYLQGLPPQVEVVLNGDVIDNIAAPLSDEDWQLVEMLRELCRTRTITWVAGNHDLEAAQLARSIGAQFMKTEYLLMSGGKKILCVHGHQWDQFITKHPWLTIVLDFIYLRMQYISRRLAVRAKRSTRTFRRCVERVHKEAVKYARSKKGKIDAVVCGHVHEAAAVLPQKPGDPAYYNLGSWVDVNGHYLTVESGVVTLHEFIPQADILRISA